MTIDCQASGFSSADYLLSEFHKNGINLRKTTDNYVSISLNETTTISDLATLIEIFAYLKDKSFEVGDYVNADRFEDIKYRGIPADLTRRTPFMEQEIFNSKQSETELMRYTIKLADKDYGLANGMMPLGSCTMKLNSSLVMMPITYPGFCNIHPFAPKDQTTGYNYMIQELESMLTSITHYAKISLQPNSGANGEFAGITAIMKYHHARSDYARKLCLIPTSAHGTNPSTASICGLTVVPINCDSHGNIDMSDFREKIKVHSTEIAAVMITYPSTYGVFESSVKEICDLVHLAGGMVYLDGANMNAQMGLTSPGKIGADIGHLNLHKTFSIPHGGGGPGVGAIGCVKALEPYLPGHCVMPIKGRRDGAVNGAPYGNAGVLPISYAYLKMCGASGLLQCSQ